MFKDDLTKFKNIRHGCCFYDSDGYTHVRVKPTPSSKIETSLNSVCIENGFLYHFKDEDEVYTRGGLTLKDL